MLKLINILLLTLTPSIAFANEGQVPESGFMSFVPLILIFIIFYFLLIRPQQKKAKDHQEMVKQLKIGNNVCTASGIIGKIKKINEEENLVFLEIDENVVITVLKASVNQVLDSDKITKIEKSKSSTKKTTAKKTKTKK